MQRLFIAGMLLFAASCSSNNQTAEEKPKEEQWVLDTKVRYDYKLNNTGNFDTTFIHTQKYKDGLVTDTAVMFVVSRYKGNTYTETAYRIDSAHKPVETMVTLNTLDALGRSIAKRVTIAGKLLSEEKFSYNDSNMLVKAVKVQARTFDALTHADIDLALANLSSIHYDTLVASYAYDQNKKVIATKFTNGRGALISRDVNLYSGDNPLFTASIDAHGDTLKRIKYEINKELLTTLTETDSLVQAQNFIGGVEIAKRTKYKNRNEQWRTATKFDEKGRRIEENLYKLL